MQASTITAVLSAWRQDTSVLIYHSESLSPLRERISQCGNPAVLYDRNNKCGVGFLLFPYRHASGWVLHYTSTLLFEHSIIQTEHLSRGMSFSLSSLLFFPISGKAGKINSESSRNSSTSRDSNWLHRRTKIASFRWTSVCIYAHVRPHLRPHRLVTR